MSDEIADETIKEAWDRIARTPDGAIAYGHMQRIAIGVWEDRAPSDGALRQNFGRRSLAHDLMGLMAKGVDESGGRTSSDGTGGKRTERPVVFRVREPTAVVKRESSREWATRSAASELGPRSGDD